MSTIKYENFKMSYQAVSWAYSVQLKSNIEKSVLACLAHHADSKTNICFPSQSLLSKECSLSVESIRKAVKNLNRLGLIQVNQKIVKSNLKRNEYIILMTNPPLTNPPLTNPPLTNPPLLDGDTPLSRGGQPPSNVGINNHINNQINNPPLSSKLEGMDVDQKNNKTLIPENYNPADSIKIELRKKYTNISIEDEIQAFINYSHSKNVKYASHDHAFRNWCKNAQSFAEDRKSKAKPKDNEMDWYDREMAKATMRKDFPK